MAGLDARTSLVRIPPELDVPLTPRVRQIIDAAEFRRLARVSQLGLVALVYPAANHSRFEHSLGVYRLALLYLKQLSYDQRFAAAVSPADAELFLAGALVARHRPLAVLPSDRRHAPARRAAARAVLRNSFLSKASSPTCCERLAD